MLTDTENPDIIYLTIEKQTTKDLSDNANDIKK